MLESVVVTEGEYRKGARVFRSFSQLRFIVAPENELQLAEALRRHGARAVIVGVSRYSGPLYEALESTASGRGSIIVRFGVGHDGIDKALASASNCLVCNTPGALDESVAEHVLWLAGCLARRIPAAAGRMRLGEFNSSEGGELAGKRLGIVGFGRIGRRVAQIANFGFKMSVCASNLSGAERLAQSEKCSVKDLFTRYGIEHLTNQPDELFSQCDYLSVHLPANPSTRNFISHERLGMMKATARLINTSRGSVIDEVALFNALCDGKIAGAALDVFEHEPYQPEVPTKDLRTLENAILTPHIGSNTSEANLRMAEASVKNVVSFFAGRFDEMSRVAAGPRMVAQ